MRNRFSSPIFNMISKYRSRILRWNIFKIQGYFSIIVRCASISDSTSLGGVVAATDAGMNSIKIKGIRCIGAWKQTRPGGSGGFLAAGKCFASRWIDRGDFIIGGEFQSVPSRQFLRAVPYRIDCWFITFEGQPPWAHESLWVSAKIAITAMSSAIIFLPGLLISLLGAISCKVSLPKVSEALTKYLKRIIQRRTSVRWTK